ncbi:MAG: hypothetical protein IT438_12180 [Phycisphaerales bacterium]|nr:hypothetical protein [Phycisphaerales bacterium]
MTGTAHPDPSRRFEIACRIAGTLAEFGRTRLTLRRPDQQITCDARATDLPALLLEGSIDLASEGLSIRFTQDSVQWDAQSDGLAREIAAACA